MKTTIELQNGFTAELAVSGDYYKLTYKGETLYQDSACEECYDEADAEVFFNELIDSISEREQGILKSAIEDGFIVPSNCAFENLGIEAENYLIENTPEEDKFIDVVTDFWSTPNYLFWMDEDNNVCIDASGEIVSNDYKLRSYYRYDGKKLEKVSWAWASDEDVYCYLDTVVTTRGKVVILIG